MDALGYFRRMCSRLKEIQSNVHLVKETSSSLLLRISSGMTLFQVDDHVQAGLSKDFSPRGGSACTVPLSARSANQASFRLVDKSDLMRGLEKANAAAVSNDQNHQAAEYMDGDGITEDASLSSRSSSDTDSAALNTLITDHLLFKEDPVHSEGEAADFDTLIDAVESPPSDELVALGRLTSMEKLSLLCTLINTLHFWEDELLVDDSWSTVKQSSVYTLIAAARESQKRLFKLLSTSEHSRPALCCAAVGELVRAYPPQKLLPTGFLQALLAAGDEDEQGLTAYQDDEAASFWDMVITFAACLMDEHGTTAEQAGFMLVRFLCPAAECEEARGLQMFLESQICRRNMCGKNKDGAENFGSTTTGARSSMQSKTDASEVEAIREAEGVSKCRGGSKNKLWNAVIGLAWRRPKIKRSKNSNEQLN